MIFLGVICIGAVGSGVWEYILKPILLKGRDLILNITTLWITGIKDDIYKQIAKGLHEAPSLDIYFFLIIIVFNVAIIFALDMAFKYKDSKNNNLELLSDIKDVMEGKVKETPSIEKVSDKQKAISGKFKCLLIVLIVFVLLLVSLMTQLFTDLFKKSYINYAITHFNQMHHIVKPYLTSENEKLILSKFAQITNKQDYESVLSELYKIADKQNLVKPKFSVW